MKSSWFALPIVALPILTLALGLPDVSTRDMLSQHERREVVRLRAHFDSVDSELHLAGAAALTPAQSDARATLIRWLREYRDAGSFPHNDRFPDRAMPYFRDSRGVLCAMAYLIDRSGRGDLVDRVAATRNNAFIPDLAADPDLRAWLDSTGLSVAEAARIQPTYGEPPAERPGISTGYTITSIVVSGASVATAGLNALSPSRTSAWLGLAAGGAGIIAGLARVDSREGSTDDVAQANVIAGTGALMAGIYRLLTPFAGPVEKGTAITPLIMPVDQKPAFGLAVHATF